MCEKNFEGLFDDVGSYFLDEIKDRRWDYLLHNNMSIFVPSLVNKFYASFGRENYDADLFRLRFNWRRQERIVDVHTISQITGILPTVGSHLYLPLENYILFMETSCRIADKGISGAGMYKNVFATCRWASTNVAPSSHTSSFYEPVLQIVHALMTRDYYFCMCQ